MNPSDGFVCLVIQYIFQVFCQILTYCYHVQLRDSVFFYRQRQWDPVLLNQHLRFLYDSNAMPVSLFSQNRLRIVCYLARLLYLLKKKKKEKTVHKNRKTSI